MSNASLPDGIETTADERLYYACKEVARAVLVTNRGGSADLIDTVARRYLAHALSHQDYVRGRRESDDVIEHAVQYIAGVHAIPPLGTDDVWFASTLSTLIELAVPNSILEGQSCQLLAHLQEGLAEAAAHRPVERADLRLSEDDAREIARLQAAGQEHGAVSDLLDLIERLFHGDLLAPEEKKLFLLASLAAPLTRHVRAQD